MDDRVRKYRDQDYPVLCKWFKDREMLHPDKWFFSDIGFIVEGIGAGFLYTTNSGIAHVDGYITNKEANYQDRQDAIESITRAIIFTAIEKGVKLLCFSTQLKSIEELAPKFDASYIGSHTCFAKRL